MGIGLGDPPRIQHSYEKWPIHTEVTRKKVGFSSAFHKTPQKNVEIQFSCILYSLFMQLYIAR
jgi:hypothetical protein